MGSGWERGGIRGHFQGGESLGAGTLTWGSVTSRVLSLGRPGSAHEGF